MSKFSGTHRRSRRANVTAPVRTTGISTHTHQGAAYERQAESEPFLLAATTLVREDTFYERAMNSAARFPAPVHEVTGTNPRFIAGGEPVAGRVGLAHYLRQVMLGRSNGSVRWARPPARSFRVLPTGWTTGDLVGLMTLPVIPGRPTDRPAARGR